MACANGVSALSLPWTNVSVHASSNVPVRGVAFGVGTPAQTLSLWPSFYFNDTWVPNSLDCDNSLSNLSCIAVDGGLYATSNSSSYEFAAESSWNGSNTLTGVNTYLNDKVQVASNAATIWGMPLVQQVDNFDYRSPLGLGRSSTFLKGLVDQNQAPSTTYGIWSGSQSVDNPLDGSLVIGGYDKSKVGSLTNFSSIPECLACAVVSGLEVTLLNGSTASLLNATVPNINIAIDPYFALGGNPSALAVPDEIRDLLVAASQSIFQTDVGVYGWQTGKQPGSLKVTFNNGYSVTIPGSELWLPLRSVNSAGQPVIQNASQVLNVLRASGPYASKTTYTWGQPILSTNYMIVWPDDGVWGLSPISNAQKTASANIKSFCSGSDAPASTSSGTSSSTSKSSGSNTGAIAGGVVGGILGLILILAAIYFLRRRSKKRRANANNQAPSEMQTMNTVPHHPDTKSGGYSKVPTKSPTYIPYNNGSPGPVELAGNHHSPPGAVEMSAPSNHVAELHGSQVHR